MNRKEKRRQKKREQAAGQPPTPVPLAAAGTAPDTTPKPFTPPALPTVRVPTSGASAGPAPAGGAPAIGGPAIAVPDQSLAGDIEEAVRLVQSGRMREARDVCQSLRDRTSTNPVVFNVSAMVEFQLGNAAESLSHLEEAIRLDPLFAEAHSNKGNILQEMGDPKAAEDAYREALRFKPGLVAAHCNLGAVLQEQGRFDGAVDAYRVALDLEPGHFGTLTNFAACLKETGDLDKAEAAYRRAIDARPDDAELHANLSDVFVRQGRPDTALEACDAYLADDPSHPRVLASKAIALNEAGDLEGLAELVNFDRYVMRRRIGAPAGFDSVAALNAALAEHVAGHPSLVVAPSSHATRLGKHSGELLVEPKGPVAGLETEINAAVADYTAAMGPRRDHPFVGALPATWRLHVWGIFLDGQGYQESHIHPTARLSGVYYVRAPSIIGAGGDDHAGWIRFGRPSGRYHWSVEPPTLDVMPEEGLMLLFPPSYWHETIPFEADETRISIAFDVID